MTPSNGKTFFIANVIVSILIMSFLILFVFPIVREELGEQFNIAGTQGILVQSKYQSWNSTAICRDSDTGGVDHEYQLIPDTFLPITIQHGSRIAAVFSSDYWFTIWEDYENHGSARPHFRIMLGVDGVGNETIDIHYNTSAALQTLYLENIGGSLYIDYVTPTLSAGTYNVTVKWISLWPGLVYVYNWLWLSRPDEPHIRSLWVNEFNG